MYCLICKTNQPRIYWTKDSESIACCKACSDLKGLEFTLEGYNAREVNEEKAGFASQIEDAKNLAANTALNDIAHLLPINQTDQRGIMLTNFEGIEIAKIVATPIRKSVSGAGATFVSILVQWFDLENPKSNSAYIALMNADSRKITHIFEAINMGQVEALVNWLDNFVKKQISQ